MDTLIFIAGFLGFVISIVMLIVNMIKKKPKKKLVVLLLASVIMLATGANMDSDDNRDVSKTPKEPIQESVEPDKIETVSADAVVEAEPEYIKISAMDLYQEYKDNEVKADNRYKKETLEITGTINNIGKDIVNSIYITLDVGEYLSSVQCYFKDSESESVANLIKGQEVTIIGRCDGMTLTSVIIKNSKIKE